jgi:hypothetical protein
MKNSSSMRTTTKAPLTKELPLSLHLDFIIHLSDPPGSILEHMANSTHQGLGFMSYLKMKRRI